MHRLQLVPPIVKPEPKDNRGLSETIGNAVAGTNNVPDGTVSDANLAKIGLELRRAAFDMEFAQAMQALRHLESAQANWKKLLESTLHDNIGRRISGSEQLLRRFTALRRFPPPSMPNEIDRDFSAHLHVIQQQAKWADDGESIERLLAEAKNTKQQVLIAFAFHQARADQLDTMRESAAALAETEVELHSAESLRVSAHANHLKSAAQEAADELEVSLKMELAQLERQREDTGKVIAQLQSRVTRIQKGETLNPESPVQGVASREDYEQEMNRIRTDLVAFTTPGYVQPESADKLVYRKTKLPFSYSSLQRIGALEDSKKGRTILLRVGGSKSATQKNDRPLGNFPMMNSISDLRKPEVVSRLKESQRLLRQYGSLMVEDGLLSP